MQQLSSEPQPLLAVNKLVLHIPAKTMLRVIFSILAVIVAVLAVIFDTPLLYLVSGLLLLLAFVSLIMGIRRRKNAKLYGSKTEKPGDSLESLGILEIRPALQSTDNAHIVLTRKGVPIIRDTTMKVIELVVEQKAYGWSPEELHFQHPHLSLGQIHAALAYYWDHVEELDADIERRLQAAEQQRDAAPASPLANRLAALKNDA